MTYQSRGIFLLDDRKDFCDALRMVDAAIETRMEALRRRLLKAVKVDGVVTYKELSLALGQNPTFVQQFVTKRSPKRLHDEQVEAINQIIDAKSRQAQELPRGIPEAADTAVLQTVFERLRKYPAKLQERVISFAEFEMHRYDKSRENDT